MLTKNHKMAEQHLLTKGHLLVQGLMEDIQKLHEEHTQSNQVAVTKRSSS